MNYDKETASTHGCFVDCSMNYDKAMAETATNEVAWTEAVVASAFTITRDNAPEPVHKAGLVERRSRG
jgi:hypothetical protein